MVKGKQTVLFIDLDNTIISNPFEKAIFPHVAAKISKKTGVSSESIIEMFYLENENRMNNIVDPLLATDWDDIVITIAKRLGIEFYISIEQLVCQYAHPPHVSILRNADNVLSKIRKSHRLIVAVTNGLSKYQLPVLRALGIEHLFDEFLAPDKTNSLKGHRDFYGNLLDTGKVAISVGDSYQYDIIRPKNLGMHAVWLNSLMDLKVKAVSPFERVQYCDSSLVGKIRPDAIISNLAELPSVIDKIEEEKANL